MGFEPQIRKLVLDYGMPKTRQTQLFSATFPDDIKALVYDFMNQESVARVNIGGVSNACCDVVQSILKVGANKNDKVGEL